MTTTERITPKTTRVVTGRAQRTVPASPASDPTNVDGDRTTVIDGKVVVVPAEKPQQ